MNFRTWTALALCGAAVAAQAPASRPAAESRPAPIDVGDVVDGAVKVRDLDGAETTFADLRGKTVAIVFYSTQCPWMKAAEPKLKTLHAAWKSDKDVVFLAVDANRGEIGADPWANGAKPADPATTYADIRAHLKKNDVAFPIYADHGNRFADLLRAKTTPHCMVVDAKGVLRYSGALDDDGRDKLGDKATPYFRNAVEAVKNGRAPAEATNAPYG